MKVRDVKLIKRYAERVISKDSTNLNKDDWNEIGQDLIPNTKNRAFFTKKIIMSNKDLANRAIIDILSRNNIDADKAFTLYNDAEIIAKKKDNSKDLIAIADRYVELLDLKPKQQQQTTQTEVISFTGMLENGQKGKIVAKQEVKTLENKPNLEIENQ
jgi:hypothetical protein